MVEFRAYRIPTLPRYPEAMRAGQGASNAVERDELVRLEQVRRYVPAKKDLLDPVPFLQRSRSSTRIRLSSVQMLRKLEPTDNRSTGQTAFDKAQNSKVRKAIKAIGAVSFRSRSGRPPFSQQSRTSMLLGQPPYRYGSMQKRHERQIGYLSAVGDPENSLRSLQAVSRWDR